MWAAAHRHEADEDRREVPVNTPLEVAVSISATVVEARSARTELDVCGSAAALHSRYPDAGFSLPEIAETLKAEAIAAGVRVQPQ